MRMVTNGPQGEGHHALSYIRDLQPGEKDAIDEAQQLLRSFSANWEGNASNRSFERFNELFGECIDGIKKASGHLSDNDRVTLSRAAIEAADTISSWPGKILSGEYGNLGVDSQSREGIEFVAKQLLAKGAPLSVLRMIADCRSDSLVSVTQVESDGRKHFIAYFRKEVLEGAGMPHARNWVVQELLSLGLSQLQRLAATVLKSYRGKIEEAGRTVLSFFNETLYGNPMLVPKENLSKLGQGADLSFIPVERPNLEGVLRAADAAERLLDAAENAKSQNAVESSPVADPGSPEQKKEAGPADLPRASDLAALLTYVSSLSADLEKRWSSLVTDEGSESHKEALNKWYSFISSLKNHIEKQGERDPRGDRLISRFPMKAEDFKPSSDATPIREALKEVEIAELYAVRNLLNVMQALRSPTATQIDLLTGLETHWWESGAFNLVRKAAEVAIRVVQRRDQILESEEAENSGSSAGSGATDTILHVSLSRAAMDQGMPEASVIYCSLALRGIAAKFGVEGDSAEQVARAIGLRARGELREPAERAMNLVRDMASGVDIPVEQVFNLANFWYEEIGPLVESAFMYTRPTDREADS
jgi:hypothetical protein